MTRQIKFRAWHPEAKLMSNCVPLRYLIEMQHSWDLNSVTWMQFTGLKDYEGKEIYEKDIASTHDGLFVVVWEDGCTKLMQNGEIYPYYFGKYNMRVIGNIHENPELLEE